jgi:hypothetical protein
MRFEVAFEATFPQGAYLMGDIQSLTEYLSSEDKAGNRPVRRRIDEQAGRWLYRATVADPSAGKERDKSIAVEIAADVQPVPPETSGQAKWITWVVRATGLRAVDAPAAGRGGSAKSAGDAGKSAA